MISADFGEVNRLANELGAAGPKVERKSESEVLSKAADDLLHLARASAPVDLGDLVASIEKKGGKGYRIVGDTGPQQERPHGYFQEFGTSVMAPQPWLWIHVERIHRQIDAEMAKIGDPFAA